MNQLPTQIPTSYLPTSRLLAYLVGGGIVGGATLGVSFPEGVFAGAPVIVSGGTPIVYVDGEYAPIEADVGAVVTPYMFVINGVETGVWFESPTTLPEGLAPGDTVQIRDALGRLSRVFVVPGASNAWTHGVQNWTRGGELWTRNN